MIKTDTLTPPVRDLKGAPVPLAKVTGPLNSGAERHKEMNPQTG